MILSDPAGRLSGPGSAPTLPALAEPEWRSDVPDATCSIDGCDGRVVARGWCGKHYQRWKTHGDPLNAGPVVYPTDGTCTVQGCTRPIKAKRMCSAHYQRCRIHGDPTAGQPQRIVGDDRSRFMAKVDTTAPGGCWLWTAHRNADGYGVFRFDGQMGGAHRFAYRLLVGPVPEGMELDHLCRVRHCVNPDHLEVVTHAENVRRAERWVA